MTTREGRFGADDLYYRVWDATTPRATVVLSHGYAEHSGRYEHVGNALAQAGFTTWALDHYGHGQSGGERASIGSLPRAVANVDALVDLATDGAADPTFVIGHS